MRYTTERQLREAGYGEEDVADLRRLRTEGERYIRREQGGSAFQPVIDEYAGRPWFPLAFIPREVPETPEPWEMDFDPATLLGQITCPVLAPVRRRRPVGADRPQHRGVLRAATARDRAHLRWGACAHDRPRGRGRGAAAVPRRARELAQPDCASLN